MKILPVFAVMLFFIFSCKPDDKRSIFGGGKGGNTTVRISPTSYGEFVDTCKVYIKYGSLDAPAGGVYDDSLVCTVVNDTSYATFTGLTVGLYYFLAVGYHTGYGHAPNVRGGKSWTIHQEDSYRYYVPTYSYIP